MGGMPEPKSARRWQLCRFFWSLVISATIFLALLWFQWQIHLDANVALANGNSSTDLELDVH